MYVTPLPGTDSFYKNVRSNRKSSSKRWCGLPTVANLYPNEVSSFGRAEGIGPQDDHLLAAPQSYQL